MPVTAEGGEVAPTEPGLYWLEVPGRQAEVVRIEYISTTDGTLRAISTDGTVGALENFKRRHEHLDCRWTPILALRADRDRLREREAGLTYIIGDLISLARNAMAEANNDGAGYDIEAELKDARAALAGGPDGKA